MTYLTGTTAQGFGPLTGDEVLTTDSLAKPATAPKANDPAPDPRQVFAYLPWALAGLLIVVAATLARGVRRW